jgi:flagellar biosynthetic protein FliP
MNATACPSERTATIVRYSWMRPALVALAMALTLLASGLALAADVAVTGPNAPIPPPPASGAQTALRILALMTVLSLLPSIVLTMSCFTRIIIVFSFLRQALGVQGMPPNQVLVGMALFLSAFIMSPVATRVHEDAITPLMDDQISVSEAFERTKIPMAKFMLAHTHDEDLRLFVELSRAPVPATRNDVAFTSLVPAFVLSEIRTAFQMGFLVLLPFMVIDLVVSSVLMAMGMMMLPPALIALPLKIMIFVLADGWSLLVASLARSFSV